MVRVTNTRRLLLCAVWLSVRASPAWPETIDAVDLNLTTLHARLGEDIYRIGFPSGGPVSWSPITGAAEKFLPHPYQLFPALREKFGGRRPESLLLLAIPGGSKQDSRITWSAGLRYKDPFVVTTKDEPSEIIHIPGSLSRDKAYALSRMGDAGPQSPMKKGETALQTIDRIFTQGLAARIDASFDAAAIDPAPGQDLTSRYTIAASLNKDYGHRDLEVSIEKIGDGGISNRMTEAAAFWDIGARAFVKGIRLQDAGTKVDVLTVPPQNAVDAVYRLAKNLGASMPIPFDDLRGLILQWIGNRSDAITMQAMMRRGAGSGRVVLYRFLGADGTLMSIFVGPAPSR